MKQYLLVVLICWAWPGVASADLESTMVLPKGVRSSKVTYATFSGLSEKYNSSGLLEGVADQYHIELTSKTLSLLNSDFNKLVNALNQFSPNERLGDSLSLGSLEFKASPVVDYICPTFAYGLTENFSIGLGVPIIHYVNDMEVITHGSNVSEIHHYVGSTSQELSSALTRLGQATQNMAPELNSVLALRGYKPLRAINESRLGDLQVSGVYRYYNSPKVKLAVRPYIQFPTGQVDDPDDLEDLATGGQPAAGVYSIHEFAVSSRMMLASSLGYQANFQDTVSKRVPRNSDDILPDESRRDTVRRRTGNSTFIEAGSRYGLSKPVELGAFYELTLKDPDWFDGDKGWDYSVLALDTGSQIHQLKAYLQFSTVNWYYENPNDVPFELGYIFGDTFFAVNSPKQITNQLYLRVFF